MRSRSAPLIGLLAVSACAHAQPANDVYGRRVDLFQRWLASFPACDPATVGATDIVAAAGARATVVGTLSLSTGLCEQLGEAMHGPVPVGGRAPSAGADGAGERRCWACEASSLDWRLVPPGAQQEILLSMPVVSWAAVHPSDCDGSALEAALGDDRTVMVTGRFRAPPSPTAAFGLMGVMSSRQMEVEAICRVITPRA